MKSSLIFRQLFDPETSTYTYLLADSATKEAALIDTVLEQVQRDHRLLQELDLTLKFILDTHVHADHITGSGELRDLTGAKVALSKTAGVACADIQLVDGQELNLGSFKIRVIATPGHTDTCLSYYCNGRVFTGDVLFVRDVGRTDFQQGSNKKMYQSITEKLFSLPPETQVYPGHDYKGQTASTVAEEIAHNSKLGGKASFTNFEEKMLAMKLAQPKKIHIAVPANLKCGKV